ncbi:histidine phosphatase family protein [Caviibacterium pharyngocola]|uniref:Histidine phosphatase family protein n=1 Tax=Caviibacterium pharyngocola TaxID=28159 RepID=A0A2M8RYW8_9PAST|nr:histidine phosphatase family protein [Caviibacterium pharyngocola]PJG84085.1 histidine phosphatase family protein [Caviibacterium pharyngocola]
MKKQLTFYLIRHGRTLWNDQRLLQGRGDSPLLEEGIRGAKLTGEALKHIDFTAAYSSVLQRTIDTAKHIIGTRNIPLFQHCGLNEHFFGSWEGMLVDTIRHTPEFQQMLNDPARYTAEINGGETYGELAERAMNAIRDIIAVHHSGNILIVSHGHTLRLLLALFDGSTWQNHRENQRVPSLLNTAINVVRYEQNEGEINGRFILDTVNSAEHLALESK